MGHTPHLVNSGSPDGVSDELNGFIYKLTELLVFLAFVILGATLSVLMVLLDV